MRAHQETICKTMKISFSNGSAGISIHLFKMQTQTFLSHSYGKLKNNYNSIYPIKTLKFRSTGSDVRRIKGHCYQSFFTIYCNLLSPATTCYSTTSQIYKSCQSDSCAEKRPAVLPMLYFISQKNTKLVLHQLVCFSKRNSKGRWEWLSTSTGTGKEQKQRF